MQNWNIGYDYINTLGMQIIKGRNFSTEFGSDSTAMIINETTAELDWICRPHRQRKFTQTMSIQLQRRQLSYNIIGVVKNFQFRIT